MQTIGLIGGMSWESSVSYYEALNRGVAERLGGLSSAKTVLASVDLAELRGLQEAGRWDDVARVLVDEARAVERAGADFLLLTSTTFHRVADQVAEAVDIPFVHLADVLADAVKTDDRVSTVALIGTKVTMQERFFIDRLSRDGLQVVVPDPSHHDMIDRVIYDELVHGQILDSSRREIVSVIEDCWDGDGGDADGVILGCTELELLVQQFDTELPIFPATTLHVQAALDRALA